MAMSLRIFVAWAIYRVRLCSLLFQTPELPGREAQPPGLQGRGNVGSSTSAPSACGSSPPSVHHRPSSCSSPCCCCCCSPSQPALLVVTVFQNFEIVLRYPLPFSLLSHLFKVFLHRNADPRCSAVSAPSARQSSLSTCASLCGHARRTATTPVSNPSPPAASVMTSPLSSSTANGLLPGSWGYRSPSPSSFLS